MLKRIKGRLFFAVLSATNYINKLSALYKRLKNNEGSTVLTARDILIARKHCRNNSAAEIAAELKVSLSTVYRSLRRVKHILGINEKEQLLAHINNMLRI